MYRYPTHNNVYPPKAGGVFCRMIASAAWLAEGATYGMVVNMCSACLLPDPCLHHHCHEGHECDLDEDGAPVCVCTRKCPYDAGGTKVGRKNTNVSLLLTQADAGFLKRGQLWSTSRKGGGSPRGVQLSVQC